METVAVILAGGGGTRFWPLSRQNKPKQLLNLSGKDVMVNDTIKRYESVIPLENTIIVTNIQQAKLLDSYLIDKVPRENILKEPIGRNTAACILYAAFTIKKKYGDAIMLVLPSDLYFNDEKSFHKVLKQACNAVSETNKLVTIGIKPTFPATGYGYINYNKNVNISLPENSFTVNEFVEKPKFEKAKEYVASGDYLWNSAMFTWKSSTILEAYERYLPRVYSRFMEIYDYLCTDKEYEYISKIYPSLQAISIDYGILERSTDVLVVPGDFGWSDVGSWDALGVIIPCDENGNIIKAIHEGIGTKNSIIYANEKLVATIGIENLIIADTSDALLICPRECAQDVKDMVEHLKSKGLDEYI